MPAKNGKTLTCVACNKEYYVPLFRVHTSKFCSTHCQKVSAFPTLEKECLHCKKTFKTSSSRVKQRFCGEECRWEYKDAEKEKKHKERFLKKAKRGGNISRRYRKLAFMFKEKKCQVCAYDEYDFCLDVHHLDEDRKNNELDNLIILCAMCHRKVHKKIIDLNSVLKKTTPD
jgi:5-methylcytosine-specific restriction endonuclease McrA